LPDIGAGGQRAERGADAADDVTRLHNVTPGESLDDDVIAAREPTADVITLAECVRASVHWHVARPDQWLRV